MYAVFAVLGIIAYLSTAYGATVLLFTGSARFLFFSYIASAAFVLAASLIARDSYNKERFTVRYIEAMASASGFWPRCRYRLQETSVRVSNCISWPIMVTLGIASQRALKRHAAPVALPKDERYADLYITERALIFSPLYALLFTIITCALVLYAPRHHSFQSPYARELFVLFATAVIARHLNFFVSYGTVVPLLKRFPGSALFRFLRVFVCDIFTLTICVVATSNGGLDRQSVFVALQENARHLADPIYLLHIVVVGGVKQSFAHLTTLPLSSWTTLVGGGLVYLTLVKTIANDGLKAFARTDDDRLATAQIFIWQGEFSKALNELRAVEHHGGKYELRKLQVLIGTQKFAGSIACAKKYLSLESEGDEVVSTNEAFMLIMSVSLELALTSDTISKLLIYANTHEVDTTIIFIYVSAFLRFQRMELLQQVYAETSATNFPLLWSIRYLAEHKFDLCRAALAQTNFNNLPGRPARSLLTLLEIIAASENIEAERKNLEAWFASEGEIVRRDVEDMLSSEPWMCLVALNILTNVKILCSRLSVAEEPWMATLYENSVTRTAEQMERSNVKGVRTYFEELMAENLTEIASP